MKCKICGSNDTIQLKKIRSPYYKNKCYILYSCNNCSSRFFDLEQYDVSINELYERLAKNKKENLFKFIKNPYWERQKKIIIKLFGKKPSSILDIGCRTGNFLMHFHEKIKKEGIEISKHSANIAKKRGLKVYNDSLENVEFYEKYDIIAAFAILEHLKNPFTFLEKINSLINKGGIFTILIPSHECLKEKLLNIRWHMYSPPEHLNFFSRKFLDSYLHQKGFILVKRFFTTGGMVNPFRYKRINYLSSKFLDSSIFNKIPIFDHMYSYYKKIID